MLILEINNKNVVSVQLVKAFLPYDTDVPFDFRMNIGLQTYPYLVLNIEELNNVYQLEIIKILIIHLRIQYLIKITNHKSLKKVPEIIIIWYR